MQKLIQRGFIFGVFCLTGILNAQKPEFKAVLSPQSLLEDFVVYVVTEAEAPERMVEKFCFSLQDKILEAIFDNKTVLNLADRIDQKIALKNPDLVHHIATKPTAFELHHYMGYTALYTDEQFTDKSNKDDFYTVYTLTIFRQLATMKEPKQYFPFLSKHLFDGFKLLIGFKAQKRKEAA